MKTLLLLLLFSTISLCLGQSSPDPVRDIDGDLVRSGTDYYILPVFRGMGGGLTLAPTRNESCPLDVVQEPQEVDNGLPLTFTPIDPKKGVIRESTDLNIIFSASSICIQSNVWNLQYVHKMKTLLFLLFSTLISLSFGQESPDPVRDIEGNLVRSGTDYYILPVFRGRGGGLTLASTRNESCPLDVVQEGFELELGLPLTFTPVNPKKGVIRESTDLNIIFSASTTCIQSNVWNLEEYEGQLIVSAHGVSGNPGRETISNWFKIAKYENDYKLVFCPTVCNFCKPVCGDLGIKIAENGSRRLAISVVPFKIQFRKA
ncbi:hypothetical protein L6452_11725 [Arctium lappa]|uniref:Uncharacterized protein n=2 Tax=Arctium lappa TaxID=4217 RepID=A0ACB9DQ08_ARCLA|nr:hypothetical protein L6452_11722 [Arctium lappa]KAI3748568.1 hypothetical protein L6452_11725 [Arctium lappa]